MSDTRNGEQPRGEAWERLVEACKAYCLEITPDHIHGKELQEAFSAYEAAQSAEPPASPTEVSAADQVKILEGMLEDVKAERDRTIAELRSELDETRTERHAYKSRLREFCQRLVDMVGAEGPEDVQGMLDKVNAEIQRLKQSIDSLNASLADKEGFLNSAGDEIERLTKERDELRVTIDLDRANWDRVQDANYRTIAELQARLDKPEMPECVRELLEWAKSEDLNEPAKQIAAVEAHYAPPFRIDKLGVYATENGNPWEVIYIDPKGGVVARHKTTKLLENFHMSGACKGGQFSLTKYLRPLEG